MIDQYAVLLRNNQRSLYSSMIKRGQLHEREKHIESALEVWQTTLGLVQTTVGECREALAQEIQKSNGTVPDVKARPKISEDRYASGYDDGDESAEKKSSRVGAARLRLRTFLELEHACFFWIGTAYFQLKEQQDDKKGKKRSGKSANGKTSEEYEQMESEYYDMAKRARLELMQETRSRTTKYIAVLEGKKDRQEFVEVPDIEPPAEGSGGIETGVILDGIRNLANVLNDQVVLLDDWREKLIALLIEPLVDDDTSRELEGNEVEVSVEKQEESYAYMSAIRALVADRDESLTNTHHSLIAQDTKSALERPSKMHAELFRFLIAEKNRVNPLQSPKSMKRLNNELRALIATLKTAEDRGDKRAKMERTIAEQEQQALQKEITTQVKACVELFK
jgi:E3 ubiquitin-protein ligase SHPRH